MICSTSALSFSPALRWTAAAAVLFMTQQLLAADPPEKAKPPEPLDFKAQRLVVFKDGYCMVIKKAIVPEGTDDFAFTDDVPDAAVLGSFWAIPDQGKFAAMSAAWVEDVREEQQEFPATQTHDLLIANLGREAKVTLNDGRIVTGVIHHVLANTVDVPVADLAHATSGAVPSAALARDLAIYRGGYRPISPSDGSVPGSTTERTVATAQGQSFVIRTEEGDVMLPVSDVKSLTVKDMNFKVTRKVTTKKKTKRITFRFSKSPRTGVQRPKEIELMYFRPGIRWVPTYKVELAADEKNAMAKMQMQAEILNEAEDVENVPVDIVVGVPNFRFKDTPSPFTLENALRNALNVAAPQIMANNRFQQMSNSMMNQAMPMNSYGTADIEGGGVSLPPELTAGGTQDLFVYKIPKLTLLRGERTAVDILSAEVPYKHVYTWEVSMRRTGNDAAPAGAINSPLQLSQNTVWHQIQLVNTGTVPWTTGAVMMTQNGQPLSQELMTYTPVKGQVRVPLTIAVDLHGSQKDEETNRTLQAVNWGNQTYAKIEKKATLALKNSKSSPIDIEITFRTGGKATKAGNDGKIAINSFRGDDWENYAGHPAVNNSSTTVWKATVEPGKAFESDVDYHFYSLQ